MARVMIAQWKSEFISLSVLSVVRVMMAQWENVCNSLSALPCPWFNFRTELGEGCPSHLVFPKILSTNFKSQLWWSVSRDLTPAGFSLPTRPEPMWPKMAQSPLNGTTEPVDIEQEG